MQAFQTPPPPGTVAANDVIPGLWGYLNGNLFLDGIAGDSYLVRFTLFGSESGWTNQLRETQGNTVLIEQTDIGKSISYQTVSAGAPQLLKFQFETIAGSVQPILVNGPDPDGAGTTYVANGGVGALRTFYVSFCIDPTKPGNQQRNLMCNETGNATTGDIAWLALDDSGAGPNDNHDDWVGYVQVTRVPDGGATLALLGGALMAVAALRRKFDA